MKEFLSAFMSLFYPLENEGDVYKWSEFFFYTFLIFIVSFLILYKMSW